MCGRFSEHLSKMYGWVEFLQDWPRPEHPRHNVAPTTNIGVVTAEGGRLMLWGMIPSWSDSFESSYATFNARIETLREKPTFRGAWKHGTRCLIPARGYFEWKQLGNYKQPYFIHDESHAPLVFAGLWEPWEPKDGKAEVEPRYSCTIITKPAEGKLAALHDRLPVMLELNQAEEWLRGEQREAEMVIPFSKSEGLTYYPVSRKVNNARVQADDLIDPIDDPAR
ncbi:SOS response-associated peptidase [Biformimicrobium ophioploci]|uniref:Abasic site processing protein n=1 Tax=Biformimicrobium ophioploci TaxID=3036711 RepID=A0ABQ6LXB4_9GAMM|nr:SOS response-associated peptidase [Microbulbifer sp. NKW57]GMG86748.1 SOS response-associated peptidase [Microbulbifer sp. NKW57]